MITGSRAVLKTVGLEIDFRVRVPEPAPKETVDALRYLKLQPRIECETYCAYDAGVPIPVLVFNALSE